MQETANEPTTVSQKGKARRQGLKALGWLGLTAASLPVGAKIGELTARMVPNEPMVDVKALRRPLGREEERKINNWTREVMENNPPVFIDQTQTVEFGEKKWQIDFYPQAFVQTLLTIAQLHGGEEETKKVLDFLKTYQLSFSLKMTKSEELAGKYISLDKTESRQAKPGIVIYLQPLIQRVMGQGHSPQELIREPLVEEMVHFTQEARNPDHFYGVAKKIKQAALVGKALSLGYEYVNGVWFFGLLRGFSKKRELSRRQFLMLGGATAIDIGLQHSFLTSASAQQSFYQNNPVEKDAQWTAAVLETNQSFTPLCDHIITFTSVSE